MTGLSMDAVFCIHCDRLKFSGGHRCPPLWRIWCLDHSDREEDAREFYADDAERAAEVWAEHHDAGGDYHIVGGETTPLLAVRSASGGPVTYHWVRCEAVPRYDATPPLKLENFKRELKHLWRCGSPHEAGRLYALMLSIDFDEGGEIR